MILQAYFELALGYIARCQVQVAGAQRNVLSYQLKQLPYTPNACKRTQVLRTVPDKLSRYEHPGKWLLLDDYIRVGFIIFQVDIEARLVMFYKGVLEQEGIMLVISNGKFDIPDKADEAPRLKVINRLIEVGAHPLPKVLCLTDIQQNILLIIILITPWLMR